MPDRTPPRRRAVRQPYDLPTAYEPAGGNGANGHAGAVDDHADDEGVVRAVPRDQPFTPSDPSVTAPSAAPAPRSRQDIVRAARDGSRRAARARRRSSRSRWVRRGIAVGLVVVLVPVAYSYVSYLRRPGTDALAVRSVEWFRDHGADGLVNTVERWWYTNNPPPKGGRPERIRVVEATGAVEPVGVTATAVQAPNAVQELQHLPPPTARVPTPAPVVEPNEGVWMPAGRLVDGVPAEYITFVRPDAAHTSYYTALMWLDTTLLRAVYVPGLAEPGGGPNPWGSQIPAGEHSSLIAAFNSGFKMDQASGGVYIDRQPVLPLVDGAASFVIYADGRATVGAWGRDATLTSDVVSVRQNLELLVDGGQLNPAIREDDTEAFGATLGNKVNVWRSGVGVTQSGALVYAGGNALSVVSLARTLQNAGAVHTMELDINSDWVSAYTYVNETTDPSSPVVGIKLGGDMSHGGDRYFQPGERDFFAFFANPEYTTLLTP